MKRTTFIFAVLLISLGFQVEAQIPMVTELGFTKDQFNNNYPPLPRELSISLCITQKANYIIYYGKTALNNGGLRQGENRIILPAQFLFDTPGEHVFILETSSGNYHFKYEIKIHSHIQPINPSGEGDPSALARAFSLTALPPAKYKLEMYIKGNKAVVSRKTVFQGMSETSRQGIVRALGGLKSPRDNSNNGPIQIPGASMSISGLPALIYHLVKKKEKPRIPKLHNITGVFMTKGDVEPQSIQSHLTLIYKVVK